MNIRCRGPKGQFALSGVDPESTVTQFQQMLEQRTGLSPSRQDILVGFPPKALKLERHGEGTVSSLGISNGETILLREREAPALSSEEPVFVEPAQATSSMSDANMDEDEALARALAASLEDLAPAGSAQHMGVPSANGNSQPSNGGFQASAGPGSQSDARPHANVQPGKRTDQQVVADAFAPISLGDGSYLTRRIIASDNSCLFNAVGYVVERSRHRSRQLREVIAKTVAGDKQAYSAEFLGKDNSEYQHWIQDPKSWGGAIELSILSRYYCKEIAAYDIQTRRVDVYGEDQGYTERAFVLYDGLHYDALAQSGFDGAPEELDVTLFETFTNSFTAVDRAAAEFVAKAHAAKQYTDTGNFTLRCGICKIGVKGEKEAVKHAQETGHQSFQEYK